MRHAATSAERETRGGGRVGMGFGHVSSRIYLVNSEVAFPRIFPLVMECDGV
jgi:hypothetical protein